MKKLILSGAVFLLPAIALAQNAPGFGGVLALIDSLSAVLNRILPLIIGLGVLYFFWGLARFILNAGDEEEQKKARGIMLWGIIAIFVMLSIWGIVNFLVSSTGLNNNTVPNVPEVPTN